MTAVWTTVDQFVLVDGGYGTIGRTVCKSLEGLGGVEAGGRVVWHVEIIERVLTHRRVGGTVARMKKIPSIGGRESASGLSFIRLLSILPAIRSTECEGSCSEPWQLTGREGEAGSVAGI